MKKLFFLFLLVSLPCFASDKINVQVMISEDVKTSKGVIHFNDALYYPIDQWPVKQKVLDKARQERIDNFRAMIEAPQPEPIPLTEEQIQADIDAKQAQIDSLQAEITEKQAAITTMEAVKHNEGILQK